MKAKIHIVLVFLTTLTMGCNKIEPEKIPAVTTDEIELYSEGIYTLNGTVTTIGKEEIIDYGFYWSESESPDSDGSIIRLGHVKSTGRFSSKLSDILPGKTYYVKAYLKAGSVTYYGDEKSFSTPVSMVHPIIDIDKNIYYPVEIGDQTWMNENLKVSHYPDGSVIQRIEDPVIWYYMPWYNAAYCWYDNFGSLAASYGNLYTWPAAMNITSPSGIKPGNVQGVCPDGWHLPGDSEWKQLEMFLGMGKEEADNEKWRGENEGGKLKYNGAQMWESPNSGGTNESSFGALPAGWRDGAGNYRNIMKSTKFWTSSFSGDYAWMRQLDYNSSQIYRCTTGIYEGISVRCIKDSPNNK